MRPGDPAPRALLITGTVGAGKTSVAEAVGGLLGDAEVPSAVIDLDWLAKSRPAPPGDRFNFALLLRNLRSVAGNYLDAGATRLILAGVVESGDERERCGAAVGAPLSVCRLQVGLPEVRRRLVRRHEDEPAELRWHLDRSGELDRVLVEAGIADFTVEAGGRPIAEVAAAVIEAAGLLPAGR
ncbi:MULTISPECIES: hypothetical protein [Thermomonosporaceae]|uniref:hypothetical protein n=1 Tax=Thermomonosporaceae TaxID=2012 RepID=UPI00255AE807|nr:MULTISPECIES: hypothetical protein [Thermomonosporaceae]MDL4776195.1 hypothetical protein [Actinomadura xylanilytica]